MTTNLAELQIEGLVGPTHNYAGLAPGNVASTVNAQTTSNPQEAALQSLEKMKFVSDLGVPVAIMPPHPRPALNALKRMGYSGTQSELIAAAYAESPELLANIYSSSNMWVANAGTVSPSSDCADGKLHITPANLISSLHRSIEPRTTTEYLRRIFADKEHFTVHDPLNVTATMGDEGAANHMRLCDAEGTEALHIFIYGSDPSSQHHPRHFPARQQKLASETVAQRHQISPEYCTYIQQHPDAIDAGIFHNDVIAMSHGSLLVYHEMAFVDAKETLEQLQTRYPWLILRKVTESELPLAGAVSTYFFNAQMLSLPSGGTTIIFPTECKEHPAAHSLSQKLVEEVNPVESVHYLNCRESMKNGGGPACLRLRVPMTDDEIDAMHQGVRFNQRIYQRLGNLITERYRTSLTPDELHDIALADESLETHKQIFSLLKI